MKRQLVDLPDIPHLQSASVIAIVVAVLLCVCSVATSQAVDSQNKERDTARWSLRTIIVDNYQPYTFMNEKGSPDGFSVEIIKAVAKAMDLDLESVRARGSRQRKNWNAARSICFP